MSETALTNILFRTFAIFTNSSWIPPESSLAPTVSGLKHITTAVMAAGQCIISQGRALLGLYWPFDTEGDTVQFTNIVLMIPMAALILGCLVSIVTTIIKLSVLPTDFIPQHSRDEDYSNTKLPPVVLYVPLRQVKLPEDYVVSKKLNKPLYSTSQPTNQLNLRHKTSKPPTKRNSNYIRQRKSDHDNYHHSDSEGIPEQEIENNQEGHPESERLLSETLDISTTEVVNVAVELPPSDSQLKRFEDGTRVPGSIRTVKRSIKLAFYLLAFLGGFIYTNSANSSIGLMIFEQWNMFYVTIINIYLLLLIYLVVDWRFIIGEYSFHDGLTLAKQSSSHSSIFLFTKEQIQNITRESYYLISFQQRCFWILVIHLCLGRCFEVIAQGTGGYQEVLRNVAAVLVYITSLGSLLFDVLWTRVIPTARQVGIISLIRNILLLAAYVFVFIPITNVNCNQMNLTELKENYGWKAPTSFGLAIILFLWQFCCLIWNGCHCKCERECCGCCRDPRNRKKNLPVGTSGNKISMNVINSTT